MYEHDASLSALQMSADVQITHLLCGTSAAPIHSRKALPAHAASEPTARASKKRLMRTHDAYPVPINSALVHANAMVCQVVWHAAAVHSESDAVVPVACKGCTVAQGVW